MNFTDIGLLALRLGVGFGLAGLHGFSKLAAATAYLYHRQEWGFVDAVASLGFPLPALFAVAAALSESLAALLVAVGAFTRISALLVSFTMLVAVYRHLSRGENAELAALYLVPALGLALTGPGRYSLDAVRDRFLQRSLRQTQGAAA